MSLGATCSEAGEEGLGEVLEEVGSYGSGWGNGAEIEF